MIFILVTTKQDIQSMLYIEINLLYNTNNINFSIVSYMINFISKKT